MHEGEEGLRLAHEESHVGQELNDAHCDPRRLGWTNYGTYREAAVQERTRFRHDQISLEALAAKWSGIEVWERETIGRICKGASGRETAVPALSDQV